MYPKKIYTSQSSDALLLAINYTFFMTPNNLHSLALIVLFYCIASFVLLYCMFLNLSISKAIVDNSRAKFCVLPIFVTILKFYLYILFQTMLNRYCRNSFSTVQYVQQKKLHTFEYCCFVSEQRVHI